MIQNAEGRTIKPVMFDNKRELVAGRTRGFCEQQGIRIVLLVPYSPSSNAVVNQFVGVARERRQVCAEGKGEGSGVERTT